MSWLNYCDQIKYHKHPDKPGARIVAFEVEPFSVKHTYKR